MNLLERFTSLSLKPEEQMVDYLIRAEELSQSLDQAGEKISQSILISIVLKVYQEVSIILKQFMIFQQRKHRSQTLRKLLKFLPILKILRRKQPVVTSVKIRLLFQPSSVEVFVEVLIVVEVVPLEVILITHRVVSKVVVIVVRGPVIGLPVVE